jgi:hypothetical protein
MAKKLKIKRSVRGRLKASHKKSAPRDRFHVGVRPPPRKKKR